MMSRYSRFDRDRVNKLFGKQKLIKKPLNDRKGTFFQSAPSYRNPTSFSNANYITMETMDKKMKFKQKLKFRCYQDEDVYGVEIE